MALQKESKMVLLMLSQWVFEMVWHLVPKMGLQRVQCLAVGLEHQMQPQMDLRKVMKRSRESQMTKKMVLWKVSHLESGKGKESWMTDQMAAEMENQTVMVSRMESQKDISIACQRETWKVLAYQKLHWKEKKMVEEKANQMVVPKGKLKVMERQRENLKQILMDPWKEPLMRKDQMMGHLREPLMERLLCH